MAYFSVNPFFFSVYVMLEKWNTVALSKAFLKLENATYLQLKKPSLAGSFFKKSTSTMFLKLISCLNFYRDNQLSTAIKPILLCSKSFLFIYKHSAISSSNNTKPFIKGFIDVWILIDKMVDPSLHISCFINYKMVMLTKPVISANLSWNLLWLLLGLIYK